MLAEFATLAEAAVRTAPEAAAVMGATAPATPLHQALDAAYGVGGEVVQGGSAIAMVIYALFNRNAKRIAELKKDMGDEIEAIKKADTNDRIADATLKTFIEGEFKRVDASIKRLEDGQKEITREIRNGHNKR